MRRLLLKFSFFLSFSVAIDKRIGFTPPSFPSAVACDSNLTPCFAKGFGGGSAGGGGGFGAAASASTKKKVKKSEVKKMQGKVLKKYGGDIAKGTQRRIDEALGKLPPHVYLATQLYQQLQKWDAHVSTLSVLQQANISPQEEDAARRAKDELNRLCKEHGISENDIHNIFQKMTWDASADAKALRAVTGEMPKDIADRVDRACKIAAETVRAASVGGVSKKKKSGLCLDVGCGFGVLVPHLTKFGLSASQIHGVDLSTEMIRNARERHRGVAFEAADFLNEYHPGSSSDEKFDCIVFCSALHDLPDPMACLEKAGSLLRSGGGGKIVVVHPQGAKHVLDQARSNPVLVNRGLPNTAELRSLCGSVGLELEIEPAEPGSARDTDEGYLAVLTKKSSS